MFTKRLTGVDLVVIKSVEEVLRSLLEARNEPFDAHRIQGMTVNRAQEETRNSIQTITFKVTGKYLFWVGLDRKILKFVVEGRVRRSLEARSDGMWHPETHVTTTEKK